MDCKRTNLHSWYSYESMCLFLLDVNPHQTLDSAVRSQRRFNTCRQAGNFCIVWSRFGILNALLVELGPAGWCSQAETRSGCLAPRRPELPSDKRLSTRV